MMWIDRQAEPRAWSAPTAGGILLACGSIALAFMLRWYGFSLVRRSQSWSPALLLSRPLVYTRLRAILLVFAVGFGVSLIIQALAPVSTFQVPMLGHLDIVCPILPLSIGAVASLHSFTTFNTLLLVGVIVWPDRPERPCRDGTGGRLRRFSIVTGTYVAVLIAFLHSMRRPRRTGQTGRRLRVLHFALVTAAIIISGMTLPSVRDGAFTLYGRMVSASMFMLRDVAATRSSRVLDLYQVVPKDCGQRSAVLLRVVSDELLGVPAREAATIRTGYCRWLAGVGVQPRPGTFREQQAEAIPCCRLRRGRCHPVVSHNDHPSRAWFFP